MHRWLPLVFLLVLAVRAQAQDVPAVDVSASYALLTELYTGENLHGGVGSITGNINPVLGVTGEIAISGGIGDFYNAALGGVRFASRRDFRVTPYVQVLLGAAHGGRHTYFAFQPGGGVDFWVHPQVGIRAGGDYHRVPETGDGPADFLRLHLGVVIRTRPR